MIDDEMVVFLVEQLDKFSAEQLGTHLKEEGNDPLTVEESLKEAMRRRAEADASRHAPKDPPLADSVREDLAGDSPVSDDLAAPRTGPLLEMRLPFKPKSRKRQLKLAAAAAVLVLGIGALAVRSWRRSAAETALKDGFKDRQEPKWAKMWKSDEAGEAPEITADFKDSLARAHKGDVEAQFVAGVLLHEGRGGAPRDPEKGSELLTQAAAQGHLEAQFRLGFMMERGIDGRPNYAIAAKWYQQAAEQGHIRAQVNLGYIHFLGHLGLPDSEGARGWWEKAAAAGSARAMSALGQLYAGAAPRSARLAESYMWNTMALERGEATGEHIAVQQARGMLDRLEKRLTQQQIAQAQARASRALASLR